MKIDVGHVAKLANLPLKPEEKEKFGKQLSETLSYVDKLNSINTRNVESTSLSQEEALSNTKSQHNGLFKVKAILEE